jgi:hypothetical protein
MAAFTTDRNLSAFATAGIRPFNCRPLVNLMAKNKKMNDLKKKHARAAGIPLSSFNA